MMNTIGMELAFALINVGVSPWEEDFDRDTWFLTPLLNSNRCHHKAEWMRLVGSANWWNGCFRQLAQCWLEVERTLQFQWTTKLQTHAFTVGYMD